MLAYASKQATQFRRPPIATPLPGKVFEYTPVLKPHEPLLRDCLR